MTKKIKIADLPEFDLTQYFRTNKDRAASLSVVLEENDPALLVAALGDITKARGMTRVAKESGITREAFTRLSDLVLNRVSI